MKLTVTTSFIQSPQDTNNITDNYFWQDVLNFN